MEKPLDAAVEGSLDEAIRLTAPGTALRHALDMIIAANLGALRRRFGPRASCGQ